MKASEMSHTSVSTGFPRQSVSGAALSLACLFLTALGAVAQVAQPINYQGRVAVDGVNFDGTGLFKFALVDEGTNVARQATATVWIDWEGKIEFVMLSDEGRGYPTAPDVWLVSGSGAGAVLQADVADGRIMGISVIQAGAGYQEYDTFVMIGPPSPDLQHVTYWSNDSSSMYGSEPVTAVELPVVKGLYSVLLGDDSIPSMQTIGTEVFANPEVHLKVWFDDGVNGSQALAPNPRLSGVGYAVMAQSVADGAVTAGKIGVGAVGGLAIAEQAVLPMHIADYSIMDVKIWHNANIAGSKIAAATTSARGTVQLATDGEVAAGKAVQADDSRLSGGGGTPSGWTDDGTVVRLTASTDDSVGIGATGSLRGKLDVRANDGADNAVYATARDNGVLGHATGNVGVRGQTAGNFGVWGYADCKNGVYGWAYQNYGVYGKATQNYGVYGTAAQQYGVAGNATQYGVYGTANTHGVYGYASQNYGVYGKAANNYGVYGNANVYGVFGNAVHNGVYGNAAQNFGVYGNAAQNFGVYGNAWFCGVYGNAVHNGVYGNAALNYGVYGTASQNYGVYGKAAEDYGVYGNAHRYGVYGNAHVWGVYGNATYFGVWGQANDTGVYGNANEVGVCGVSETDYGVYGAAAEDYGVYGNAAQNYGVYGDALDYGVYGKAAQNYGVYGNATEHYGVYGNANVYGVYGKASYFGVSGKAIVYGVYGNAYDCGGYFNSGDKSRTLAVEGNIRLVGDTSYGLIKSDGSLKAFTIDHPLDPDNAVLRHFSAEGPEALVIYSGTATLDANGEAEVALPDYFDALARHPRVQLTARSGPMPSLFAPAVEGNLLFVMGGAPNGEIYWQVTAERDDPKAQRERIERPVEQPKGTPGAPAAGTFVSPECF